MIEQKVPFGGLSVDFSFCWFEDEIRYYTFEKVEKSREHTILLDPRRCFWVDFS